MRLAPLLTGAVNALFPPACAVCRGETGTAQNLCPACWRELAFLDSGGCYRCGRPVLGAAPDAICDDCMHYPPRWRRGRAVFRYEGAGRKMVLALKHGDRLDIVPMLGSWLARVGRELLEGADAMAPVPLHWTRRLKRRGNQAAALAQATCRAAGQADLFTPRLLVRTKATPSQDGRNRVERVANIAGALEIAPGADIQGRRVVLVDDVLTTGATLSAAAEVCYAAGASCVDVIVLALVVREEGAYMGAEPEDLSDEASRDLHDPDLPLLHDGEAPAGPEGRGLQGNQRDG